MLRITFALLCLATTGCSLQTALIFPGAATQGRQDAIARTASDEQLLTLTTKDGIKIEAHFGKALDAQGQPLPNASTRPTIIYFYGNGSCMAHANPEFEEFRRLGLNVIVADYAGYGMSEGSPSETNCYATADAEYDYLLSRTDIDPTKIIPTGWSLGGAVAIDLASRRPAFALMTFSAFTNMDDMGNVLAPWIPQSIFLSQHFNNIQKIATISCPIFIAHGTDDSIVPPEMADKLAAAAKGPVTQIHVQGADHNDLFEVGGEPLAADIGNFIEKLASQ